MKILFEWKIEKKESKLFDLFYNFNLLKLEMEIKNYLIDSSIDNNEEKFLEKAFYLYNLGMYLECYKILKEVSQTAFRNRKLQLYFLSELNRKNLLWPLKQGFYEREYTESEFKLIEKEILQIDIESIFWNLPSSQRSQNSFLRKIINKKFVYDYLKNHSNSRKEINRQKKLIENGGTSYNSTIQLTEKSFFIIWNYINKNYLLIENTEEVQSLYYEFIESILSNYSIKRKKNSSFSLNSRINKLEELNYFNLFIIITGIGKVEDLENLFEKLNIKNISVDLEDRVNLLRAFFNLVDYFIEINTSKKSNFQYCFYNYLFIFRFIKLEKDEFSQIVSYLSKYIKLKLFPIDYEYINAFILSQFNNNKDNIEKESLILFIEIYLNNLFVNNKHLFSLFIEKREPIIKNIIYIIEQIQTNFIFSNEKTLIRLINEIKSIYQYGNFQTAFEIINIVLIPIYKTLPEEIKYNSKKLITEILSKDFEKDFNVQEQKSNLILSLVESGYYFEREFMELFYNAIFYIDEVRTEKDLIKKYIDDVIKIVNIYKNKDSSDSELYIISIEELTLLIRKNKISLDNEYLKEKIHFFRENNLFTDFIIEPEKFDFEKFNIEWLKFLSKEEHRNLSSNENIRRKIFEKLKDLLKKDDYEKKYKEIFFEYYIEQVQTKVNKENNINVNNNKTDKKTSYKKKK